MQKKHEVEAIFYYQTKLPEFMKAYSLTLYSNTNREDMIQKLTSTFTFPYFIVKGSSAAELYPVPTLRTMGDIDLAVQVENRSTVHEILINQGYECRSKQSDREWQYYKNGMEFELHDHLIYSEAVNNPKQEMFFNNFWPYVKDNHLDWNFHFLFLIAHLRKHFMNEGVGFRQFMDVAVMAKYADLDWNWIEERAEEIELSPFLKTVLAFCNRWFETVTPIITPSLDENFYEAATQKIFDDGVFGFENEENAGSTAVNIYRKKGKKGQIGNAIRQLFPSYKTMITVPHYGFLKGKPYLLPVAWGYRAFRGRNKSNGVVEDIKDTFASNDVIAKREAMYKQWGL